MQQIKLASILKIIPVIHVNSISGNTVTPKSGKSTDTILIGNEVSLSENPQTTNGNTRYTQTINGNTESKLNSTLREKYTEDIAIIAIVYKNNLTAPLVIGSLTHPAYISIVPTLNADSLTIRRESIIPVL